MSSDTPFSHHDPLTMYTPDGEHSQNRDIRVFFVGDPNLGESGFRIVRRHFAQAHCAIWRRGDAAGARIIRDILRSEAWDILLSFYNDLLFSSEDLACAEIAINIHPSSPRLRGVGYDVLPILMEHATHGATLHHMVADPDAGRIIDVLEEALPHDTTASELRRRNQRLCLLMLEQTVGTLHRLPTPLQIQGFLEGTARRTGGRWSCEYFSRARVSAMLEELRSRQPDHRVFR